MKKRTFRDYLKESFREIPDGLVTFGDLLRFLPENMDKTVPCLPRRHLLELIDSCGEFYMRNDFTVDQNIDILQILLKGTEHEQEWKLFEENPEDMRPIERILQTIG